MSWARERGRRPGAPEGELRHEPARGVAKASMGDEDDMQKAQALVNQLQTMKDEAQGIAQKISELDQERHEHSLVAETLEKLDSDRKCYRCVHPSHGAAHTAPAQGGA